MDLAGRTIKALEDLGYGSAIGCEAGLRPPVEVSKSKWGYAPGSGLALVGQRPNRGPSPFVFFSSVAAGRSPASHPAAKPVRRTRVD